MSCFVKTRDRGASESLDVFRHAGHNPINDKHSYSHRPWSKSSQQTVHVGAQLEGLGFRIACQGLGLIYFYFSSLVADCSSPARRSGGSRGGKLPEMRNLHLFQEERVKLKQNSDDDGEVILAGTLDSDNGRMFFASNACNVYSLDFNGQVENLASLSENKEDGTPPVLQEGDRFIAMEFLLEKEMLVLGSAAGDIVQLDPVSREVEVVGALEGGIVSMVLSPDGDRLLIGTGLGQLLLMTQDWDVLYEVPLNELLGSSRSEHISPGAVQICWRGDGKFFATLENESRIPGKVGTSAIKVWDRESGMLQPSEKPENFLDPVLSWSPSGAFIASAYGRSERKESPVVVLFEKNGLKRQSFDILAPPEAKVMSLQWNSNSELLAVLGRYKEWDFIQVWNVNNYYWYLKQEWRYSASENVRMFWDPEKPLHLLCWTASGILHRITLCWKSAVLGGSTAFVIDGRNLLITCLSLAILPPPMFSFKVTFPAPVQTVAAFFENTRCWIAAGLSDGSASVYILPGVEAWDDLEHSELAASRVVSESVLDFGKFRHLSWLSSGTLVGSVFSDVVFSDVKPKSEDLSLSTSNLDPGCECLVEFKLLPDKVEGLRSLVDGMSSFSDKWILKLVNQTSLDLPVAAIASSTLNYFSEEDEDKDEDNVRKAEAFVQLMDGSVVVYSSGGFISKQHQIGHPWMGVKFASASPWMQAIAHFNKAGRIVVLIGLDLGGRLQVDDKIVSHDCTSFILHESTEGDVESKVTHLIFTTRADTLHVINLEEMLTGDISKEEVKDISSNAGKVAHPSTLIGKSRARMGKGMNSGTDSLKFRPLWERGARLLSTLGGTDVAVILQTIRGNLETIFPRGLVLGAIATALNEGNFKDALILARRHHLNPNVIVDYKGWEEFCQVAHIFVKQIQDNLSHVTEFVRALTTENVMETTYKNLIPVYEKANGVVQPLQPSPSDQSNLAYLQGLAKSKGNKVQEVLKAIRNALQEEVADSPARELCILTTLAVSEPPELEGALVRIKALRETEVKGMRTGAIANVKEKLSAEAGVKHLIWLSDTDIVFTAALGLYDLHLAAMVASNAQQDPKEFVPLLEEFGKMPAAQMRYSIDCKLGRFESALKNGAKMGSDHFETCLELVREHPTLFPSGLEIFKVGQERACMLDALGDHLVEESKFEEAGATFCACSQLEKALAAYKMGGFWESAMTMAGQLGKSSAETIDLATELRDELQAMGRPRDAAKLALDYCRDTEGAIELLLEAHDWSEASRLAYLQDRGDLVGQQIEPSVLETSSTQLNEFNEGVEKVRKYLARFLAVSHRRELLAAKLEADKEGEGEREFDASSDISLASSSHSNATRLSGFSAYTQGSTKAESATTSATGRGGRRKSQGGKIRAGGPDEELALAEHLRSLALGRRPLEELRLLVQALLQLGHESIARKLQQAMLHFISEQQDSVLQTELKMLESVNKLAGQNLVEPPKIVPSSRSKDPLQRDPDLCLQWTILK